MSAAPAILYALFVWWFATGLVLLAVLRQRRASLFVASVALPISLLVLGKSSGAPSVGATYIAFTAAIVAWGALEVGFLAGVVTGPRPLPRPPRATGAARFRAALGAVLYHELALLAAAAAVVLVTRGGSNQAGTQAFLILWLMRLSAELNLFLGVPVLNDELLPHPIAYLRSYFRRGPVNAFFPLAIAGALFVFTALVEAAGAVDATAAQTARASLLAALLGLAIAEHAFMLVPLPIGRLWAWSIGAAVDEAAPVARPSGEEKSHEIDLGKTDRVVVTTP